MAPLVLTAPLDGWVATLDTVPDPVFAGRMLGDGLAIDPTGTCLHAPCAGIVLSVQPTGHAVTIRSDGGAELLIHLGLDTLALGGRGFTPLVAAGNQVAGGDPLIRFDLDLLVREARAVVTPVVLLDGGRFSIGDCAATGPIVVGAPLMTIIPRTDDQGTSADGADDERYSRALTIALPHGIHARPAARIVAVARRHRAAVSIEAHGRSASAASVSELLALDVRNGDEILLAASGPDAPVAIEAFVALIESGMGEPRDVPSPAVLPHAERELPPGALAGVTAAPGLCIGQVRRHHSADLVVPAEGQGVAREGSLLAAARDAVRLDLATRAADAAGPIGEIADAHAAMLDDPALIDAAEAGIARGESAGHAWRAAIRPQAQALRATGDARRAERAADLLDLERQVIARLAGVAADATGYPPGTILIAEDLLPSELMAIPAGTLAGIAVARGGPTSHVAILAASMGLPALVAIGPALDAIADGTTAILDASGGWLHPAPDATRLAAAEQAVTAAAVRRADALARAGEPCRTADGTRIEVFANLGSRADAELAVTNGAEGCGLLRTEFLFLERDTAPDTEEQAAEYQAIADTLAGRPLIVRLLDIGGDKPAAYLPIAAEENPALGLRGIRVGLAHPDVLDGQLRAILLVRPFGQCRIMVPMVASLDEVRAVRSAVDRIAAELGRREPVSLGIMVETPAAAITADLLAREADFLSIGTNDLTQYTLAMDRGNAAVASAVDGLHPAVLRLIGETCTRGSAAGRWTGVCGGLASDPLAVPLLLGLGVTELSATPAIVPEVKALVSRLTLPACRSHAAEALACTSAREVRTLANRFHQDHAA